MNIVNEKEIREMLERIVHRYAQMEKQKRNYGIDLKLSQAEIHTIAYIGENPGARQEDLRCSKGITKGAASQMITRLCNMGLVERRASKRSNAEVALHLTPKGAEAYAGHQEYHKRMDNAFARVFEELTSDEYAVFVKLLNACDKALSSCI